MFSMAGKLKSMSERKKIVLLGATTSARDILEAVFPEMGIKAAYVCDFNAEKQGALFENEYQEIYVKSSEALKSENPAEIFVLITTLFDGEASEFLKSLNIDNYMSAREILNETVNVEDYWNDRYAKGYDTGVQSQGFLLEKQVQFVNEVIGQNNIKTVFELGCGNGKMLPLLNLESYTGLDISQKAIDICRERFKGDSTKKFFTLSEYEVASPEFELSLSLGNVIPSLPDDAAYFKYMADLFGASKAFVCIFSSDFESGRYGHIKARNFSKHVSERFPEWELVEVKKTGYEYKEGDPLTAKFFVYRCVE